MFSMDYVLKYLISKTVLQIETTDTPIEKCAVLIRIDQTCFLLGANGGMCGPAFLQQGRVGSLTTPVKSPKIVHWLSSHIKEFNLCNQGCLQRFVPW